MNRITVALAVLALVSVAAAAQSSALATQVHSATFTAAGGDVRNGTGDTTTALLWDGDATLTVTYHYASVVPEPATWASLAAGLTVLGWLRRRRDLSEVAFR